MFLIKDTLVSLDLVEDFFCCDLNVCKGICCYEGDAGAPISPSEREDIKRELPKIYPFLSKGGKKAIEKNGVSYIDSDGDEVTTLINNCECAFSYRTADGKYFCALETAFRAGKLPNLKPSSCYLYPVRLNQCGNKTAVNLHKWDVCECARRAGRAKRIRAFEFLKDPLIREFGEEWYSELEKVASEWNNRNK